MGSCAEPKPDRRQSPHNRVVCGYPAIGQLGASVWTQLDDRHILLDDLGDGLNAVNVPDLSLGVCLGSDGCQVLVVLELGCGVTC